jgi:hypothetical protein
MDWYRQSCRLAGVLRCGARRWKVLLSVRFVVRFVEPLNDNDHWGGGVGPDMTPTIRQTPPYTMGDVHDLF